MPDVVRFEMNPKDDLSTRADFSADLMESLSKELRAVLDDAPELDEIRKKAKVTVSAHGMLRAVDIRVDIVRDQASDLTAEAIQDARRAISKRIAGSVRAKMSVVLQAAITQARARM